MKLPIDEAFEMYCAGHTHQEIADKFKCSVFAVRQRSCKDRWREKRESALREVGGPVNISGHKRKKSADKRFKIDKTTGPPGEENAVLVETGLARKRSCETKEEYEMRESAFRMFVCGYTLINISQHFGLSTRKVQNWYLVDGWGEKREAFRKRAQEALYFKLIGQIEQSCQRYLTGSLLVSQMAVESIGKIYENNKPEKTYANEVDEVTKWTGILERGSRIHKNVVPNADEKISEKILKELEDLNSEKRLTLLPERKASSVEKPGNKADSVGEDESGVVQSEED